MKYLATTGMGAEDTEQVDTEATDVVMEVMAEATEVVMDAVIDAITMDTGAKEGDTEAVIDVVVAVIIIRIHGNPPEIPACQDFIGKSQKLKSKVNILYTRFTDNE